MNKKVGRASKNKALPTSPYPNNGETGTEPRGGRRHDEQERILALTMSRGEGEAHRPPRRRHDPTKDSIPPPPTSSNKETRANQRNSSTNKQVLIYRHPHGRGYNSSSLPRCRTGRAVLAGGARSGENLSLSSSSLSASPPLSISSL